MIISDCLNVNNIIIVGTILDRTLTETQIVLCRLQFQILNASNRYSAGPDRPRIAKHLIDRQLQNDIRASTLIPKRSSPLYSSVTKMNFGNDIS